MCYRPDVGYVQGMSYLVAMLLLNVGEVEEAFVAFVNLLNHEFYFTFYRMDTDNMQRHMRVYQRLFNFYLPGLYNHFESLEISADMYCYDWMITIFTRALSLDVVSRVWDNFLDVGPVFLFRTGLAILLQFESEFYNSDLGECLSMLRKPPEQLREEQLFRCISQIDVRVATYERFLSEEL